MRSRRCSWRDAEGDSEKLVSSDTGCCRLNSASTQGLYSLLNDLAGFATAALNDRYPTVKMAIKKVMSNPATKIEGPLSTYR